jgi:hypothetical protein
MHRPPPLAILQQGADATMYLGDKNGPGPVSTLDRLKLFGTLPSPFSGF